MADLPILFSGPMVRALLDGTKSQTRRALSTKPNTRRPNLFDGTWTDDYVLDQGNKSWRDQACRFAVGDRLWVREAWTLHDRAGDVGTVAYQATLKTHGWTETIEQFPRDLTLAMPVRPVQLGWRPSIHMPRWASRLTLTVTNVRVERLQDCSVIDAIAEGIKGNEFEGWFDYGPGEKPCDFLVDARQSYRTLWNSINGPGSWEANPWVAAYIFTLERGNIDQLERAA